ncbi:MAG: LptA/OstA family protein [Synergistales bacterium]|nr:LptA/OstA family protein [Synergistales bacterium]MDY6401996.1 LptA/OstA family protein [Synergistales bacterium]MDY6405167.1 LptA/OstA family protein [Synergistales bacterium]MDY6409698.1 LptA/OstA family protein [Synergistales bacterium]MDY6414070.1 LptA/OstA family protein [Synergistales bacterium]
MGKASSKIIILILIFTAAFSCPAMSADFENYYINEYQELDKETKPSDKVTLNADRVSFNDETGHALAEGNAILTYNDISIMAERLDYDADTQKVQAMPLPNQQVVITDGEKVIKGDNLTYDLNTQEGILTGARSAVPIGEDGGVLYVYGEDIDVMPWELAKERKLVHGEPADYLIEWKSVVLTTCALDHPHYRLEAKKISFIPGKKLVAKRPRIYLGSKYLFTSPLDYVVQFKRRAVTHSFLPYFQRSSTRGAGAGITGSIGWDTGHASVGVAWANKTGWEALFEIDQDLGSNLYLSAGFEHSWDDAWRDRVFRPHVALSYRYNGWETTLRWHDNEYIEDQKDTKTEFKGRLERRPELIITTPYFKSSKYSWMVISAAYGRFQETIHGQPDGSAVTRYAVGLKNYFERKIHEKGNVELFSSSEGIAFFYDNDKSDHEMFRSFTGLRYNFGSVELGTGYERQSVWGESPMHWDQYKKRQRIHQRIKFPVGREVYLGVRGSYDIDEKVFDEMFYSIQWITDCMVWDLHYRNDRTSGGNDTIGLSLAVKAFPNSPASLGQNKYIDPFDRPAEIPKDKK